MRTAVAVFVIVAIALVVMAVIVDSPGSEPIYQRETEMLREYQIETSQELEREELLLDRQIENLRIDEQRYQEWLDDVMH